MAATVPEYVDPLLRGQISAAALLGVNIMAVDKQLYDVNLTLLTAIGMIMKALNDHGVVLDAEWQTRLNGALAGTWPTWVITQVPPPS